MCAFIYLEKKNAKKVIISMELAETYISRNPRSTKTHAN